MKKFVIALILLGALSVCEANGQHLKFLGIPLDGQISEFDKQLQKKGYKRDYSDDDAVGRKVYDGSFLGEKAKIVVYYNEKLNKVYSAKAYYSNLSEKHAKEKFENIKSLLIKKYPNAEYKDYMDTDYLPQFAVFLLEGMINVYLRKWSYSQNDIYSTHIEYSDRQNYLTDEETNMDDL